MSHLRRFAAIFALGAMTLSLSEGLLATACADDGAMAGMAAHDEHAAVRAASAPAPAPASAGAGDAEDGPRCPMSAAAMSACSATAILTTAALAALGAPVSSARTAPLLTHLPASFVTVGLFRPPIA